VRVVVLGSVHEFGTDALCPRQTGTSHCIQLPVGRRERYSRPPGEVADAAHDSPTPDKAEQLTAGATGD